MFKLESYIAPLLMGYIDKYVKLNRDDFQVSLWGGDVVLNKLELRLSAIEELIRLPLSLRSGWVHELRVHVPWTHLYSEPVLITINTIECTVKLRGSNDEKIQKVPSSKSLKDKRTQSLPVIDSQTAPGYLDNLVNRILNNINIIINNLILKFVEDDIVLSLNMKSAEYYSVDATWRKAFTDLTPEDLRLRKVLEINDLTICLDQRNASGKIEHYQIPLLYRCSLVARLMTSYEGLISKTSTFTKLSLHCGHLNLSITNLQVQLLYRLFHIFWNVYLSSFHSEVESHDEHEALTIDSSMTVVPMGDGEEEEMDGEGWLSWAWSYVPPIMSSASGSDLDSLHEAKIKMENSIFSFGFCVETMKISFLSCEKVRSTGQEKVSFKTFLMATSKTIEMELAWKGANFMDLQLGIDVFQVFFHCSCLDEEDEEDDDEEEKKKKRIKKNLLKKEMLVFTGGRDIDNEVTHERSKYRISLFNGDRNESTDEISKKQYVVYKDRTTKKDEDEKNSGDDDIDYNDKNVEVLAFNREDHLKLFTEEYARRNFSFVWFNYLSTNHKPSNFTYKKPLDLLELKESVLYRLYIGPSNLNLTLKLVETVLGWVRSIHSNEKHRHYAWHNNLRQESQEPRHIPTEEELEKVGGDLMNVKWLIGFKKPSINLYPSFDHLLTHYKKNHIYKKNMKNKGKRQEILEGTFKQTKVPFLSLFADEAGLEFLFCLHSGVVSNVVSLVMKPTTNMLDNCHSHLNTHLSGVSIDLKLKQLFSLHTSQHKKVFHVSSFTFLQKHLTHPHYWQNNLQARTQQIIEGEGTTSNFTKAQLLLASYIVASWFCPSTDHNHLHSLSLIIDVFGEDAPHPNRLNAPKKPPSSVEITIPSFELKHIETLAVNSFSGCLTSLFVLMLANQDEVDGVTLPVLYGPLDLEQMHSKEFFSIGSHMKHSPSGQKCQMDNREGVDESDMERKHRDHSNNNNKNKNNKNNEIGMEDPGGDLLSFSLQIQKDSHSIQAPGGLFAKLLGVSILFDPIIFDWLAYEPRQLVNIDPLLNADILAASDPLKSGSSLCGSESEGYLSYSITKGPSSISRLTHSEVHTSASGGVEGEYEKKTDSQVNVTNNNQLRKEEGGLFDGLKEYLFAFHPLLKVIEVEVGISSWCLFMPLQATKPFIPPSINIPLMVKEMFTQSISPPSNNLSASHNAKHLKANQISDIFVLILPNIRLSSSTSKTPSSSSSSSFSPFTIPQIPIKYLNQSSTGEKLPWKVSMKDTSVYSLHHSSGAKSFVDPFNITATVAINASSKPLKIDTKEGDEGEEDIVHLASCLHFDVNCLKFHLASPQLILLLGMVHKTIDATLDVINSFQCLLTILTPPSTTRPLPSNIIASESKFTNSGFNIPENPPSEAPSFDTKDEEASSSSSSNLFLLRRHFHSSTSDPLSLWLQLTFNKLSLNVYLQDSDSKEEIRLVTELNDATSSFDLHSNYCKVHFKVNSIDSFKCLSDGTNGILFSSHVTLPKQLDATMNARVTEVAESAEEGSKDARGDRSNVAVKQAEFLKITLTRVLTDNHLRRFMQHHHLLPHPHNHHHNLFFDSVHQVPTHLNEVCLSLQPFIFLLDTKLLSTLYSVACCTVNHITRSKSSHPASTAQSIDDVTYFNSTYLPLIHLNISHFYIFLPRSGVITNISLKHPSPPASHMDTVALYISSIKLLPWADNPLPRVVVEHEMYARALQDGLFSHKPGSPLEDRQYQLNITGVACAMLDFASLRDYVILESSGKHDGDRFVLVSQNPAFEWNSSLVTKLRSKRIHVSLVLSRLNAQLIIAPCVTSNNHHKLTVVCGHSMEVSISNEMEVLITSLHISKLIELLQCLIRLETNKKNNTNNIKEETEVTTNKRQSDSEGEKQRGPSIPIDILITCFRFSLFTYTHTFVNNVDIPAVDSSETDSGCDDFAANAAEIGMKYYLAYKPFINLLISQPYLLYVSDVAGNGKLDVSFYDLSIKSHDPHQQSQACNSGLILLQHQPLQPQHNHFLTTWLETKPGQPHPNTGVSASVFLASFKNLHSSAAQIIVNIERPVRVEMSEERVEYILQVITEITSIFCPPSSDDSGCSGSGGQASKNGDLIKSLSSALEAHKWLAEAALKTSQVVVTWDIKQMHQHSTLTLSLSQAGVVLRNHTSLPLKDDTTKLASTSLDISNITLTSFQSLNQPMKTSTTDHHDNHHKNLGPLTLTVEADLKVTNMSYFNNNNNNKNNKNDNNLHYSAACKVGVRDVVSQVSVQDIAVLMSIIKSLNKNNNNNKNINKNSTFENNDNSSLNGRINNCNDNDNNNNNKNNNNNSDVDADGDEKGIYYEDDLKSKEFKIVEGNNDEGVANSGEIRYYNDKRVSYLQWRYHTPRFVHQITASPVPFDLHSPANDEEEEEEEKVTKIPCSLEYSLDDGVSFITHTSLHISSEEHVCVSVRRRNKEGGEGNDTGAFVAATLWRAVLLKSYRKEEEEVEEDDDGEDDDDSHAEHKSPLSPLILAACLKVDSFFHPSFIPSFNIVFDLHHIDLSFIHKQPSIHHKNDKTHINPVPTHEAVHLFFSRSTFHFSSFQQDILLFYLRTNGNIKTVEYKGLTWERLVQFAGVDVHLRVDNKKRQIHLHSNFRKFVVLLDQNKIHALCSIHKLLSPLINPKSSSPFPSFSSSSSSIASHSFTPSCYIFKNFCQDDVLFGQYDTKEEILLRGGSFYQYFWFDLYKDKKIWLCLQQGKEEEKLVLKPINLSQSLFHEHRGDPYHQQYIDSNGNCLLVWISLLTPVQCQILITGQLLIGNQLDLPLNLKLTSTKNNTTLNNKSTTYKQLKPLELAPAIITNINTITTIQASTESSNLWSPLFNLRTIKKLLKGKTDAYKTVIELPGIQNLQVACTVHLQCKNKSHVFMVIFSPLFLVKSYHPNNLIMNISYNANDDNKGSTSQRLNNKGQISHIKSHCNSEQLITFQLSESSPTSNPVLKIDPSEEVQKMDVIVDGGVKSVMEVEDVLMHWNELLGVERDYMPVHPSSGFPISSDVWPYNSFDASCLSPTQASFLSTTSALKTSLFPATSDIHTSNTQRDTSQNNNNQANIALIVPNLRTSEDSPSNFCCPNDLLYNSSLELSINLTRYNNISNTLLVEVAPRWMLVNSTAFDLFVVLPRDDSFVKVTKKVSEDVLFYPLLKHQVAIPPFKTKMKLAVEMVHLEEPHHISDVITILDTPQPSPYQPFTELNLAVEGHVVVSIPIRKQGSIVQHLQLSVHSSWKHHIRIINISETFCLLNHLPHDVDISNFVIPSSFFSSSSSFSSLSCSYDEFDTTFNIPPCPNTSFDSIHPLFLWEVKRSKDNTDKNNDDFDGNKNHVFYLSLRCRVEVQDEKFVNQHWSKVLKIDITKQITSYHLVLPLISRKNNSMTYKNDQLTFSTLACNVNAFVHQGMVYLLLEEERYAYVALHNPSNHNLVIASAKQDSSTHQDSAVLVPSEASVHYCPKTIYNYDDNSSFFPFKVYIGVFVVKNSNEKMERDEKGEVGGGESSEREGRESGVVEGREGGVVEKGENSAVEVGEGGVVDWSHDAVELTSKDSNVFVDLKDGHSLKIEARFIGHIMHVTFQTATRVEVSAREVRSSINKPKRNSLADLNKRFNIDKGRLKPPVSVRRLISSLKNHVPLLKQIQQKSYHLTFFYELQAKVHCDSLQLMLSEASAFKNKKNFLLLSLTDTSFSLDPFVNKDKLRLNDFLLFHLSVGALQLDNKAYHEGAFDFPVLILPTRNKVTRNSVSLSSDFKSMVSMRLLLHRERVTNNLEFMEVHARFEPMVMCLEDVMIYRLSDYIQSLSSFFTATSAPSTVRRLPAAVRLITTDLNKPIKLRQLTIEQSSLLISIHASLKLFFALDSTPMNFGSFERQDVCMTKQQLSKLLTMHYALGALFRTGVVVGSLELLGNPTGLVRNISTGVYDLVYMPYHGLTLGPAACLTGFSNGIKSVLKHFSAGTLNSISNFASGISRNMERLSMDADHVDRIERMRRTRPNGLTDGLISGLAGLGLSLLGAVAGLADQPLQQFVGNNDEESTSVSSAAKGVVSGIGKGLIGVITKPIGGAAELVSLTSMGLMRGTGLIELHKQKKFTECRSENPHFTNDEDSILNRIYLHGGLVELERDEKLLCCMGGCHMEGWDTCSLILTSRILHVYNHRDMLLMCSLPLTDVHLTASQSSLSLFISSLPAAHSHASEQHMNEERVALYLNNNAFPRQIYAPALKLKHRFILKGKNNCDLFLAHYQLAKNNLSRDQFRV